MNAAAHEVAGGIVNQTVAGHRVFADKGRGNDLQFEMPAFFRSSMAGMEMGFIFKGDRHRL